MTLENGGIVFAAGDHGGSTDAMHPATQIGLPDAKVGHGHGEEGAMGGQDDHGGGADMSAFFEVSITPASLQATTPLTMQFTFSEKEAGRQIKSFEVTHDKELHLIMVSSDLVEFFHEHPALQPDGTFVLKNFIYPRELTYSLFFDLKPTGTDGILLRKDIQVGSGAFIQPFLKLSQFPVTVGNIRLDLRTTPSTLRVGEDARLTFRLDDAVLGTPIDDIEVYLASPAHLVILSEESLEYLHAHPEAEIPEDSAERSKLRFGPNIVFNTSFPEAGVYKGWLQVQRKEQITALPFIIEVLPGEGGITHAPGHGDTEMIPGLTRDQVAQLVHDVQKEEETRSVVKFAALSAFIFGMMLLFYPRRPQPISSVPVSDGAKIPNAPREGSQSIPAEGHPENL